MSETPPQLQVSPDGQFWWDGQAWQPLPPVPAPPPAPLMPPPPPDLPPPSWLATPPAAVVAPSEARGPFVATPAHLWPPAGGPPAEPWATPAVQESRVVIGALWVGVALGLAVLLFGLIGIPVALNAGARQSSELKGAVLFIVIGASVAAPCGLRLMGLRSLGLVLVAIQSLGIAGCLVVVAMAANTIAAVNQPIGTGTYVVPWVTILVAGRRAWKGRWLGAFIIGGIWLVAILILQLSGH